MRFFSSELAHKYGKLTFGYTNYGLLEAGDKLSEMYERGYLPYSGSPDSKSLFYMARSARIHLPDFDLNSECRRVAKKFDGVYTRESVSFSDFKITEEFVEFWLKYYTRAHGPDMMPHARLQHVLNFGIISNVAIYKNETGDIGGYVLEATDETMTHDWYQSYSEDLDRKSFGVWLLIDIARTAKERGATYYYPGTLYSENSYKTNLQAVEYWNGEKWIKDDKKLSARLKSDEERQIGFVDEWKETHPLF